ncbi:hypothetical protein HG1285_09186, partial [Hydrogenivirga sp. 128-5-R1-1]
ISMICKDLFKKVPNRRAAGYFQGIFIKIACKPHKIRKTILEGCQALLLHFRKK